MVDAVRSLDSDRQVTRFGVRALEETGELAAQQGIRHALVVTDEGMARTPWLAAVEASLRNAGVDATTFRGVTPTPLLGDVEAAVAAFREARCDGVVSLGGGSTHDVAKAAALLARNEGTLHDYAHENRMPDGKAPHIAVNATAGTGAERSGYAFITQEHGHEHTILHGDLLVPEVAVLDPRVHATMPARLTAATGLNALSHAVEAYLSTAHTEASDAKALAAVAAIREHLPRAVADGDDLAVRAAMAEAAYHAAEAFDAAGLGLVDSISLVVSGLFNVGHSTANALLLPHVLRHDGLALEGRLGPLCAALGASGGSVDGCVQAVLDLEAAVGIHETLADRGLTRDDLYLVAHSILRHPFNARNPVPLDEAGLAQVFLDAVEGEAPAPTPPAGS